MFFVMYMAFMIFCAQASRSSAEDGNQHKSLTNSYISSTDSAIAECEGGQKRSLNLAKFTAEPQLGYQQQQQPLYGQYYLTNATQSLNYLNQLNMAQPVAPNGYQSANYTERTPLVGHANPNRSCRVDCEPVFNYNKQAAHLFKSQPNLLDSVSIDLGLPVKNSACLIRGVQEQDEQLAESYEQHNWLNSYWVLLPMFPLTLSMKVLTPLKFKNTIWTIWTFIVSICLIGCLTYVSVWVVHLLGDQLGLPETVAGMTILSWGTGIPELIASIVLIRKTAQADMAICNTIGSNVIDASFCLSLPWLIKCMLNKSEGLEPIVQVQSSALAWTNFTLLVTLVALLVILKLHNWELSASVGIWLTLTYVAFVGVATYLESTYSRSGLDLLAFI